jgi:GH15 family glucan-1,4-alpha-glucosidase
MTQLERGPSKRLVPYPGIHQHGLIGDRRTAALVAADGTMDWMCVPSYAGDILFGALLDAQRGGYWKVGPAVRWLGRQSYVPECALLKTEWDLDGTHAELLDFMAQPENDRRGISESTHLVVRRLAVEGRKLLCVSAFAPRCNFEVDTYASSYNEGTRSYVFADAQLVFWTNAPIRSREVEFTAEPVRDYWFVMEYGGNKSRSIKDLAEIRQATENYWRDWADKLDYDGRC